MIKTIDAGDLAAEWGDAINNSSESWWYAGSDDFSNFIAIKRPYSSVVYKVDKTAVQIEGIILFEFSENQADWINIKSNNIKFDVGGNP